MRAGYDGMGGRRDGYGIRAVLATLLASACLAAFAASAAEPFRIVTLNVEILTAPGVQAGELQKYRWDEARRAQFERVASLIEALEPDVFNLLEATSREAVDLLVELLHAKGLTSYRGYHVECHDTYTGMDVAVIARRPLDEVDGASIRTFYSEADDPTWRHAYAAPGKTGSPIRQTASLSRNGCYLMTVGGHKLGFLGLHLKSNPSDAYSNAQREAQAEIARRIVRQEIAGRGYLPILLGDFNDFDPETPDRDDERETSTQVLALLKDYDPSRPGPESFNAARHIVRKEDRYTSHWDRNENGVEDPYDVFTMIDHVLLPNELAGCVRRAFIFHNLDLRTTDHRGVVVDLLLP
jgi:endonuclease/exonuclease/phosphatase family metal-dependent hydrolase